MTSDKRAVLKPLFESSNGVHLSVYLNIRSDHRDLGRQLKGAIEEASSYLQTVMSTVQLIKFLDPLNTLKSEFDGFSKFKGNIGIFRTKSFFQTVDLPVEIESSCVVATTFHVKPLIKWMQSDRDLEQALTEYRLAEAMNLTKNNLYQISRAVIQGKVKKLIIADGVKRFGKIDPSSGLLSLHPYDLDHEDDDVLDDLAQTVLRDGGEVILARRDEIPEGHYALAILDDHNAGTVIERRTI